MTIDELKTEADAFFARGMFSHMACDAYGRVRCKKSPVDGFVFFHWPDHADRPHRIGEDYAASLLAKTA